MMRRLLAVLGKDVSRSLSPLLHSTAASACGLDIAYVPVSCPTTASFVRAVEALRTLGALGCNVTIPHKNSALDLCDEISDIAREIDALNVLTFREDGTVAGDNTDGPALAAVIETLPRRRLESVQILGAGGASRAAGWAARRAGAGLITICARTGGQKPLEPMRGATLVISGLPPSADLASRTLDDWVDESASPMILDLSYGDLETSSPLVTLARTRGLEAQDGIAMLVEQAARSLALWTGGEVSLLIPPMRRVLHLDTAPGQD